MRGAAGRWIGLCALVAACRNDGAAEVPAAVLQAAEAPPAAEAEAPPEPAAPERNLWFATGPGRDAILARERHDNDLAVTQLDRLLADPDLSAADRAAAQWLRGLEDLRLRQFAAAAERFAEARAEPSLKAGHERLRVLEAQALLDAGDPEGALRTIGSAKPSGPLAPKVAIIVADARARTDDTAGAIKAYEGFVRAHSKSARRHEVRIKLARLLSHSDQQADKRRAVELYEAVWVEVPLSDFGDEAAREVPRLRKLAKLPGIDRKFRERLSSAKMHALLGRRRYRDAAADADGVLDKRKVAPARRCDALYVKGSAIFKQRKRAAARPVFERAAKACKKAGSDHETELVKSLYQAARGRYAEGKFKLAARAFTAVAERFKTHSYADDAWILAGEAWAEAGQDKAAAKAFRAGLAVGGDMKAEARRRLLVQAFAGGDMQAVVDLADDGLKVAIMHAADRGKLHYFRGRALAKLGKVPEAHAAWLQALRVAPLSYAGLQALSRLRDAGDDAFAKGLAILRGSGAGGESAASEPPGAEAALLLARLGLGQEAREELEAAGVTGWPAVEVLNRAGLYAGAQKILASVGGGWRSKPAAGSDREHWESAHPRPFSGIIDAAEAQHAVPTLLTYAIMQTESRFDPGVTSWAGARGLVQLMPSTAKGLAKEAGVELGDMDRLYDPTLNLQLGTRYLGQLAKGYGTTDAAAALAIPSYNAGAGAVRRWLKQRGGLDLDVFIESIPFDETRKYTQRVLGRWFAYRWLYGAGSQDAARVPHLPLAIPGRP